MAFLALRMVATHVENLNKSENLKIKVIEEKIKKMYSCMWCVNVPCIM